MNFKQDLDKRIQEKSPETVPTTLNIRRDMRARIDAAVTEIKKHHPGMSLNLFAEVALERALQEMGR